MPAAERIRTRSRRRWWRWARGRTASRRTCGRTGGTCATAILERLAASPVIRLNFEMACTDEMVAIALRLRPAACCIVPERREEVTTEGGLDAVGQAASLRPKIAALREVRESGCRCSWRPTRPNSRRRRGSGRRWWNCTPGPMPKATRVSWSGCASARQQLKWLGLECHAGHGLTYANVLPIASLPEVEELNIGHFLIGQAIMDGLPGVVKRMKALIVAARE